MKLSIITINYNNCEGLRKTIESVVNQTWKEFEWIIVDGGSTDGSRELIEETAKYCPNISYWCSEPDKGVYNAMNKGIAHARGDYMNFMNSGDTFVESKTLEIVFSFSISEDLIYGDWIRVFPDHEEYKQAIHEFFSFHVFFTNVCHQAMFIRTSILKLRGYDENMYILADWKRWQEMASDGYSFKYIPVFVCRFEAISGISEKGGDRIVQERESLYTNPYLSKDLREWLADYHSKMNKFDYYDNCILTRQTYDFIHEHKIYQFLIHGTLIIIDLLRKLEKLCIKNPIYKEL